MGDKLTRLGRAAIVAALVSVVVGMVTGSLPWGVGSFMVLMALYMILTLG